jgi:hypothetical protein
MLNKLQLTPTILRAELFSGAKVTRNFEIVNSECADIHNLLFTICKQSLDFTISLTITPWQQRNLKA